MQRLRQGFGTLAIRVAFCFLIERASFAVGDREAPSAVPLEIRSVSAAADTDTETMTDNTTKGPEAVYVRREVILDLRAIKTAGAAYGPTGWVITIELTDDGAKRFSDYCTSHAGARTAILANGKLVAAPLIGKVIPAGKMTIGPVSETTAHEFAKQMSKVFHK